MGILAAYVVPHPPLIIPSVGCGEEHGIQSTIDSYQEIARRICTLDPEVIVVSSPHAPMYRDGFHVTTDTILEGSMATFGAPQTKVSVEIDTDLADGIIASAEAQDIAVASSTWRDHDMDHATFIPLYFIEQAYSAVGRKPNYKVIRVGLSGLSPSTHQVLGEAIAQVISESKKRCVFVASGDLSHKLKEDGPYGFAPEGPQLDKRLCDIFASGALTDLFDLDEYFCECAAECGVRSFQIMTGALGFEGSLSSYSSELLSYEGPFGVGYAVASFESSAAKNIYGMGDSCTAEDAHEGESVNGSKVTHSTDGIYGVEYAHSAEDAYVTLARENIEHFITSGEPLKLTSDVAQKLPDEMLSNKAGVFVSIHEHGELRGCIGTIAPTTQNIAEEIIQNGISASARDPRFPPIQENELPYLLISVDVLFEPEPISSLSELDPKRYGVIVSKGFRRGLLLPNLEGVDTVENQVAIAKRKAGIRVDDGKVELERFEVIRHE